MQCSGPTERNLMKNRFSDKFMQFFEKMVHVVIDGYFPSFLKDFEDFT